MSHMNRIGFVFIVAMVVWSTTTFNNLGTALRAQAPAEASNLIANRSQVDINAREQTPAEASTLIANRSKIDINAREQEMRMAAAYNTGNGVNRDDRLAAEWFEKAANDGDPFAQVQMGYLYETGRGVPQDQARAISWYRRAADGGLREAKVDLGVAYLEGIGVPQDEDAALELFTSAAKQGVGLADSYMGEVYSFGIGVRKDEDQARKWYGAAAELHDPLGEFRYAVLMLRSGGPGHIQNAVSLLRHSAGQGFVPAKDALGVFLAANPDLARSAQETKSLLQDAASAGMWKSSAALGTLFRDGQGVSVDNVSAYFHFRVATLQGGEEARRFLATDLRILSSKLGKDTVSKVDSNATSWLQAHPSKLEFAFAGQQGMMQVPSITLADPEAAVVR